MPRVLIVDDEDGIRSLLSTAFTRAGYWVTAAANAHSAMDLCERQRFDVILSDVNMSGMDGHGLVQWVSKAQPAIRSLLMSAEELVCHNCPNTRRCTFLQKPFLPEVAIAAVGEVLRA